MKNNSAKNFDNFFADNTGSIDVSDDELMAELLALQEEDQPTKSSAKKPERPKATEQLVKRAPQPPPMPTVSTSFLNDLNQTEELEVSDADLDDDDLLSELNELTGIDQAKVQQKKAEVQVPQIAAAKPKEIDKHFEQQISEVREKDEEQVPNDPKPPPPVPPHQPPKAVEKPKPKPEDIPPPVPKSEETPPVPKPKEEPSKMKPEETSTQESLQSKAQSLLLRRRKLYLDRAKAAKEGNDRSAAVEAFETVKMFNQALDAIKQGAVLSDEDLQEIPPSPPPYGPPAPQPSTQSQPGTSSTSSSTPAAGEAKKAPEKVQTKQEAEIFVTEEHRLVSMRQTQLKKAAMEAKQRGDMRTAKEYLTLAHRMDQMVEAASHGLPIDVQQIPNLTTFSKALPNQVSRNSSLDDESLRKCQLLERELLKQIEFCQEKATQFQAKGDSKNTLLYEGLQQKCKQDLQRVQLAILGQVAMPGFKLQELTLPDIDTSQPIPDDMLLLKITKIEELRLPKDWKPSHCSLYVFYKFPYPHGTLQTGRTSTISGTTSPEFPEVFQLNISRKTKQFLRICKRVPLKLEIYQKGGFLRSDKLFGLANVPLQNLEEAASITGRFDILEGRKKTGAFVHVEIRISKPLGFEGPATSVSGLKRKWVRLDQ